MLLNVLHTKVLPSPKRQRFQRWETLRYVELSMSQTHTPSSFALSWADSSAWASSWADLCPYPGLPLPCLLLYSWKLLKSSLLFLGTEV